MNTSKHNILTPPPNNLFTTVQVTLVVAVTFEEFFKSNALDPNSVADEFKTLLPPDYAENYDPDFGNVVKQNPFVRNMASVLRINPQRIRVTNIVPGNRRLRRQLMEIGYEGIRLRRRVRELSGMTVDGLDVKFDINKDDPCQSYSCGDHGACDDSSGKAACKVRKK